MNPIVRNILAVIAGFIIGGIVNGGIIAIGGLIIPLPEGADVSTAETLKASMPLFSPQHFISPFLAHAIGTLVGAFIAAKIAISNNFILAMTVGFLFLIAGITMVFLAGGPIWFIVLDLVVAYIPMAFLGWKFSGKE